MSARPALLNVLCRNSACAPASGGKDIKNCPRAGTLSAFAGIKVRVFNLQPRGTTTRADTFVSSSQPNPSLRVSHVGTSGVGYGARARNARARNAVFNVLTRKASSLEPEGGILLCANVRWVESFEKQRVF